MSQYAKYPAGTAPGGVLSINGNTSSAQSIVGGSGISVSSAGGTTTITNTLSAGANTALSNLTAPTAINQNLLFGTDNTLDIGSADAGSTYFQPRNLFLGSFMTMSYGGQLQGSSQGYLLGNNNTENNFPNLGTAGFGTGGLGLAFTFGTTGTAPGTQIGVDISVSPQAGPTFTGQGGVIGASYLASENPSGGILGWLQNDDYGYANPGLQGNSIVVGTLSTAYPATNATTCMTAGAVNQSQNNSGLSVGTISTVNTSFINGTPGTIPDSAGYVSIGSIAFAQFPSATPAAFQGMGSYAAISANLLAANTDIPTGINAAVVADAMEVSSASIFVGRANGSNVFSVTYSGQVRAASLSVANSATATGPVGTITHKIEVFDATGTSLGFLPVYDSIT
jgi:hypothetical protein